MSLMVSGAVPVKAADGAAPLVLEIGRGLDETAQSCVECHSEHAPGKVRDWLKSLHARSTVTCIDCHRAEMTDLDAMDCPGTVNVSDLKISPIVSPADCGRCHITEEEEFTRSKHARTWTITADEIKANEATYFEQASRILDPTLTEVRHNSEWLGSLTFPDVITLMSKFTVAEMLRRDNFRKRFDDSDAVYLHEFLYSLMQGYDAYALECDVQVGGTEQLFNLMAGRKIQQDREQRPHVPVTLPILVGLDGKERMSKSKGNHIGVGDEASEQYGKAMSIPDEAMMNFFILATNIDRSRLPEIESLISSDPMAAKKLLAGTIAEEFHGDEGAREAATRFEQTIQRKEVPTDMPERPVNGQPLVDVLVAAGLVPSKREARRLFEQRAVSVDGKAVDISAAANPGSVVQIGKRRWLRLTE